MNSYPSHLTVLTAAHEDGPVWLLVAELPDDCPEHETKTTSPASLPRSAQSRVRSSPSLTSTLSSSTVQLRLAEPDPDQVQFRLKCYEGFNLSEYDVLN